MNHLKRLKTQLYEGLLKIIPDLKLNGPAIDEGHPKILNLGFPPSSKSTMLLFNLDIEGISVSGGSACSSGTDIGSHVLRAIHPENPYIPVRFSFSHLNTSEEIEKVIQIISRLTYS
jgi:cysteine desulfurase